MEDFNYKMYSDCPKCKQKAYMFPFSVVIYTNQTVITMTLLCPACYTKHVLEYGLESLDAVVMSVEEMTGQEVDLVHQLDAI